MEHLKQKSRPETRFRISADRHLDTSLEAQILNFSSELKMYHDENDKNSRVFEYQPFQEGWIQKRWQQSLNAVQDMRPPPHGNNHISEYKMLLAVIPKEAQEFYDTIPQDTAVQHLWVLVKLLCCCHMRWCNPPQRQP